MSLVLPTSALPPAGGAPWSPLEQAVIVIPATSRVAAKRRSIIRQTLASVGIGSRYRGQQPAGVVVARIGEHLVTVTLFDHPALEHHRNTVGEVLDHRQ